MDHTIWLTRTELDAITAVFWIGAAIVAGVVAHRILFRFINRWALSHSFAAAIARQTCRPTAYILPLLAILAIVPNLVLPASWTHPVLHLTGLLTIAAIAWSIIATIRLWSDIVIARHRIDVEDNLFARELSTRVDILTRVAVTIVIIVSLGTMLMTFPQIRAFGTTLLASAGVAGIVAGLAARPLFENLVAGVQLALTQPIRLDDVVIVETQFGRVEEIHSTYIVVRLWDLRRMVVPLTYFINTPFENWTRRTANLLGEVFVYADFAVDVDALRAELPRILARTRLWDGGTQVVQVTDATAASVQIRALVSAANSGDLFDLRCFVREALITYLRDQQPAALPRTRIDAPEIGREREDARPNRLRTVREG